MRDWRCKSREFRRGVTGPCGQLLARFDLQGAIYLESKCPRCRTMQVLRVESPIHALSTA